MAGMDSTHNLESLPGWFATKRETQPLFLFFLYIFLLLHPFLFLSWWCCRWEMPSFFTNEPGKALKVAGIHATSSRN